ncbi:hypothetical protein [Streptomyces sp. NPDC016845]|uniref:hypothetical protein n=1 Tax=Streptomyces sp. NPDC016845 TaxID=3364972 RepID=UPI0037B06FA7
MRWPIVSRRRHVQELAAVSADRERLRGERDQFAKDAKASQVAAATTARQFAEADAANIRLNNRNKALQEQADVRAGIARQRGGSLAKLGQRLDAVASEYAHIDGYAARMENRLARALRGCARYRAALAVETHRADKLQGRLDDACGLNTPGVDRGQHWQSTRQDKPREVKA